MRSQIRYAVFLASINPRPVLQNLAFITSFLLHPMVVAPFTFALLTYTGEEHSSNHIIFFTAFFFSTLLSTITVIYLKRSGKITDLDASIREQRVQPLVLGAIYHGIGFLILWYLNAAPIIQGLMFCYAVNTAIVWLITMKWKISIHAIGLGGPLVALWFHGIQYPFGMAASLVLVCMSRIILKAHTPLQVLTGAGLAMSLAYIELSLLFL